MSLKSKKQGGGDLKGLKRNGNLGWKLTKTSINNLNNEGRVISSSELQFYMLATLFTCTLCIEINAETHLSDVLWI